MQYFTQLKEVLEEHKLMDCPGQLYDVDETGMPFELEEKESKKENGNQEWAKKKQQWGPCNLEWLNDHFRMCWEVVLQADQPENEEEGEDEDHFNSDCDSENDSESESDSWLTASLLAFIASILTTEQFGAVRDWFLSQDSQVSVDPLSWIGQMSLQRMETEKVWAWSMCWSGVQYV